MAAIVDLLQRDIGCPSGWYRRGSYCYRNRSSWYYWGRWVLAGVIIFIVFILLLSCLCISRRRRSRGVKPMYGTGWMAPQQHHQNNQNAYNYGGQQNGFNYQNNPPPPTYGQQQTPQYTGTTFNPNDGYYGQQQQQYSGVQPPQGTYQRDDVYSPPTGPPPGK